MLSLQAVRAGIQLISGGKVMSVLTHDSVRLWDVLAKASQNEVETLSLHFNLAVPDGVLPRFIISRCTRGNAWNCQGRHHL